MLILYVSSGRRKSNSGHPVEPDAVLEVGDVVRIKDEKWFDSLEKDWSGDGIVEGCGFLLFTTEMKCLLGKTVRVSGIEIRECDKGPVPTYQMECVVGADGNIDETIREACILRLKFSSLSNEMLEYI